MVQVTCYSLDLLARVNLARTVLQTSSQSMTARTDGATRRIPQDTRGRMPKIHEKVAYLILSKM